jgi:DNA polymerase III subunit delta
MSYQKIIQQIRNRVYHPVYLLQGEEPYFIDVISSVIEQEVLTESEKEFNQTVVYGSDVSGMELRTMAQRFPMMASHMVLIVREAQSLKNIEDLMPYLQNPLKSTILVLCHKYKKNPKTSVTKQIQKVGMVFDSAKIKDYQLADWVKVFVKDRGYGISEIGANLIAESLGNDLSKIVNEFDKLFLVLDKGVTITPELIERHIGVSKDFNNFELLKAITRRDVKKVNQIILYFASNPKDHPVFPLITLLYGFFVKVLKAHFAGNRSRQEMASYLGVNPFFVDDYRTAMQTYSVQKLIRIFGYLRECDVKSKGVESTGVSHGELMQEMVFKIMH